MPDTELPHSQQTTNETGQAYETACFQTLDNRLCRTVITSVGDKPGATVTLAFFLSEDNSQSTVWGWGAQSTGSCSAEEPDPRAQGYESSTRHTTSVGQVGEVRSGCRERSPMNRRVIPSARRPHTNCTVVRGRPVRPRREQRLTARRQLTTTTHTWTTSTCSNHLRGKSPNTHCTETQESSLLGGELY